MDFKFLGQSGINLLGLNLLGFNLLGVLDFKVLGLLDFKFLGLTQLMQRIIGYGEEFVIYPVANLDRYRVNANRNECEI